MKLKYFFILIIFVVLVSGLYFSRSSTSISPNFAKIFLGNTGVYNILTTDEQNIMRSVLSNLDFVQNENDGTCVLKYYDDETVLAYCGSGGKSPSINVYSRKTKQRITNALENIVVFEGFYESSSIIFGLANERITYFKPGFQTTKSVGIKTIDSNESYVKKQLIRSDYNFSYNEQSNSITVGVFKNKDADGSFEREKLRDETYILN